MNVHHYDDLRGAHGRQVYYRPERVRARDLFASALPQVWIGDTPLKLQDLSLSGVAALAADDDDQPFAPGDEMPLELRMGATTLHAGRARVVRVEPSVMGEKVALSFIDDCLNIDMLARRYRTQALRARLQGGFDGMVGLVDEQYRILCADVLATLRSYRGILDEWDATGVPGSDSFDGDLLSIAKERIVPLWWERAEEANARIKEVLDDQARLSAIKAYTELVLTPDFLAGPIWRRSYEKPLGYPGDYLVMNYVYEWRDEGASSFDKLIHYVGLDALECVATRMAMMQRLITDTVAASTGGRPVRITNLACGTAQEVRNFLQDAPFPNPVEITLIDQDEGALGFTYERIRPIEMREAENVRVTCLNASFSELMKGGQISGAVVPQDLIYSVGLFDYLKTRRAQNLLKTLYERLAPGGQLVIGNLKDTPRSGLWAAELICDWNMIYRTERQMFELAEGIDDADMELLTDPTDRIYLLCLRKKAL